MLLRSRDCQELYSPACPDRMKIELREPLSSRPAMASSGSVHGRLLVQSLHPFVRRTSILPVPLRTQPVPCTLHPVTCLWPRHFSPGLGSGTLVLLLLTTPEPDAHPFLLRSRGQFPAGAAGLCFRREPRSAAASSPRASRPPNSFLVRPDRRPCFPYSPCCASRSSLPHRRCSDRQRQRGCRSGCSDPHSPCRSHHAAGDPPCRHRSPSTRPLCPAHARLSGIPHASEPARRG